MSLDRIKDELDDLVSGYEKEIDSLQTKLNSANDDIADLENKIIELEKLNARP